eukprot:Skav226814  [mRNA]  locus=scaffold6234:46882:61669:- [translate_table: standard]
MGYDLVCFTSKDRHGEEIYHTNAIPDEEELKTVYDALKRTMKVDTCARARPCQVVVNVTMEQLELWLRRWRGVLESCVDQVVTAHVPTLERIGGGSVRCMVAELFKRLEVDAVMPWTLDTMKVDECFNRVHLMLDGTTGQPSRTAEELGTGNGRVRMAVVVREEVRRDLFESVWGKEFVDGQNLANLQAQPFFPIRYQESRLLRAIFRLHPSLKNVKVYEGGDILVADSETVLVGVSQRTNEKGADKLAKFLFAAWQSFHCVKVFIPKQRAFMHLDTLFTFLDRQTVLTMPYFWSKPEIYAEVARRANLLPGSSQPSQPSSKPPRGKEEE